MPAVVHSSGFRQESLRTTMSADLLFNAGGVTAVTVEPRSAGRYSATQDKPASFCGHCL